MSAAATADVRNDSWPPASSSRAVLRPDDASGADDLQIVPETCCALAAALADLSAASAEYGSTAKLLR